MTTITTTYLTAEDILNRRPYKIVESTHNPYTENLYGEYRTIEEMLVAKKELVNNYKKQGKYVRVSVSDIRVYNTENDFYLWHAPIKHYLVIG